MRSGLTTWASAPPTFTWFSPPPVGPGVPFGSPALIIYDSLRVLVFAVGAVGAVTAVVLTLRSCGVVGQRIRLIAEIGLILYVVLTEAYRLGDFANMRLALAVLVTVGAAWGNFLGIRYEGPPPAVWRRTS